MIRVATPAKINWTLRVLGRREDGFHELRSWFVPLALHDTLTARPADDAPRAAALAVSGPLSAGVPDDARNLVLRAESAWRAAGGAAPAVAWHLEKAIPSGAGLGGGSGNAAGALHALQSIAAAPLPSAALEAVAAALGSDVPFFLAQHLAETHAAELRGGRGERRLQRAPVPEHALVVAWPAFAVATPAVYGALEAPVWDGVEPDAAPFPERPGTNDLAAAAHEAYAELTGFVRALDRIDPGHRFLLSGSGGAHFRLCAHASVARALATSLCEAGFSAVATTTLHRGAQEEVRP